MPRNIDKNKMQQAGKQKKLSDFASKFRKGFGGGKDLKQSKLRTKTSGQKLVDFFKGK